MALNKIIFVFLFILFLSFGVFAQNYNEIQSVFLYAVLNSGTSCIPLNYPRCIDTDGGYFPLITSSVAGLIVPMTPTYYNQLIYWNPVVLQPYCVQSSEVCNNEGYLSEVVCLDVFGVNANNFANFFPNNVWGISNDTGVAALLKVNCSVFSNNNPNLGLQGSCLNGACV